MGFICFSRDKSMRGVCRTKELTVWNYDKVPSEVDQLRQAIKWTEYAEVMHGLEDEEEEEKENKDKKKEDRSQ